MGSFIGDLTFLSNPQGIILRNEKVLHVIKAIKFSEDSK
jgi:hypothetical protein